MNDRDRAWTRLMNLATNCPPVTDRVAYADHETTLADARIAYTLAKGVPPRHISATGGDFSPRAYRAARAGWVAYRRAGGTPEVVAAALDVWLTRAPRVVAAVEEVDPLTLHAPTKNGSRNS